MLIGMIIALVIFGLLLWFGMKAWSRRLIGPIDLRVSTLTPKMGQTISFQLRLNPTGTLQLNHVAVDLRGYERIQWTETESYTDSEGRSQTRTVSKSREHDLYRAQSLSHEQHQTAAGQSLSHRGTFTIPEEGPPSIGGSNNGVYWKVTVFVDIGGLPDVSHDYFLKVLPIITKRGGG